MDPVIGGSLISAGASLIGGLFGRRAQSQNVDQNVRMQREFAQKGIQWKVADAKKAGVHPLYALGANTAQFSPVAIGGDPLGNAVADMGQDISRAVAANQDMPTRQMMQQKASLEIERLGLENDLLRTRIASATNQVGSPPALSYPVRSGEAVPTDIAEYEAPKIDIARSGDASVTAGTPQPGLTEHDLGVLGKWLLPSGKTSQSMEDIEIAKYLTILANNARKFGVLKNVPHNLIYQYATRPGWVRDVEKRTDQRLLPFYDLDGRQNWFPVKQR